MTSSSLADLTAIALVTGYRDGSFTPLDVLADTLARIEQVDPIVNAFVGVRPDTALEAAEESTRRWSAGEPLGPVDGVPATIKDSMALAGWPTLKGSRQSDPSKLLTEDSPTAARLKESGAVILGKTTCPEFAWKGCSDSPLTGLTRNPWRTTHTTGGSSAGAAAAAATGMGALHPGTDGAGSVRMPAAFTGIFALKPTFSIVPIYPPSTGGLIAHAGPMTRTVSDAALMMDVIAAPDAREIYPALADPRPWLASVDDGIAGLRIAYTPTWDDYPVHPEVAAAVERAISVLERAGAVVEEIDPGIHLYREQFGVVWAALLSQPLRHLPESEWSKSDPGLVAETRRGLALSASDLLDAEKARIALMAEFGAVLATYDLIVSPQMPCTALPLGTDLVTEPWSPGMRMDHWLDWSPFTYPLNLSRHPAASVPIGFDAAGLPIAMQVMGRHFEDRLVMRAARAYEQECPFLLPDMSTLLP
jgi:aspartyl-tRNA(Asn)/glutamyl-tRNA(Gln) amidotransferase subunit A